MCGLGAVSVDSTAHVGVDRVAAGMGVVGGGAKGARTGCGGSSAIHVGGCVRRRKEWIFDVCV